MTPWRYFYIYTYGTYEMTKCQCHYSSLYIRYWHKGMKCTYMYLIYTVFMFHNRFYFSKDCHDTLWYAGMEELFPLERLSVWMQVSFFIVAMTIKGKLPRNSHVLRSWNNDRNRAMLALGSSQRDCWVSSPEKKSGNIDNNTYLYMNRM